MSVEFLPWGEVLGGPIRIPDVDVAQFVAPFVAGIE